MAYGRTEWIQDMEQNKGRVVGWGEAGPMPEFLRHLPRGGSGKHRQVSLLPQSL